MIGEQKVLIEQSFEQLIPDSSRLASLFYGRLFELNPLLQALVRSTLIKHGYTLLDALELIVVNLDDFESRLTAAPKCPAWCGIQPRYYGLIWQALTEALTQVLGAGFTPATAWAWQTLYQQLTQPFAPARYELALAS